ncbi:MAG: cell division protein FtsQ/DivIB [Tannerella sp.]|jgi:cell division protein FtsQ|nr:cell division protein FtsQ/DivIB [Tannerella sp.]
MKKVLYIILATLLFAYIAAAIYFFARDVHDVPPCTEVEVIIADSLEKHFLKETEVVAYLKKARLYPLNRKGENINTYNIKKELLKNEIIEEAEVIRTVSGKIKIVISQKMPILRVFTSGGSYYVDKSGRVMPSALGQAIYVPVASGNIEKSFATTDLYKFALFLQENNFWNDQIEQIYVRSVDDIEIIPRVGSHRIILGNLENYEDKLERLRLFYKQVMPKMGWEKYSVINLKYKHQIVCTKK